MIALYFLEIFMIINLFGFYKCFTPDQITEGIFSIEGHMEKILKKIFNETCNKTEILPVCSCMVELNVTYSNISKLQKLYEGSSKGFIDVSSFYSCIDYKNFDDSDYNYYTLYPNLTEEQRENISTFKNDSDANIWIFGICLEKNLSEKCNETNLKLIFEYINKEFKQNSLPGFNSSNIFILDNRKFYNDMINWSSYSIYLKSIPLVLYSIQLIFYVFRAIPKCLFGICFKKKYLQSQDYRISTMRTKMTRKITSRIENCFSGSENFDDFYLTKENPIIFKDNDLTYIKGMKIIGIFFYIFGITFLYFFNYPISIDNINRKKGFLKEVKTNILIFFLRVSPAILLSCSGYSMCYKFMNFLDKKLVDIGSVKFERSQELKKNNKDPSQNTSSSISSYNFKKSKVHNSSESESFVENSIGIKFYQKDLTAQQLKKMFHNQSVDDSMLLSKTSTSLMPNSVLFNFLFRQIHKIYLIILLICFFKYSFPMICVSANKGAPLMNYLINGLINKIDNYGFGNFLFYKNFMTLFFPNYNKNDMTISILNVFGILVCEVNFFILGAILIFYSYKKKVALDYVLVVISSLLVLTKIIITCVKNLNITAFFCNTKHQDIFLNPIFNFDYYLIGMLFGLVNYVIQNDLIKKETLIKERPMVKIPIYFCKLCDYRKGKNLLAFIFIIIFLITSIILFPILFISYSDKLINDEVADYPSNLVIKLVSVIDMDAFIIFFNLFLLSCFLYGGNIIFRFFNSSFWNPVYKLYFQIIIIAPLTSYVIIYKTETRLKLGSFIIAFYGFICFFNILLIALCDFFVLEIPYKKLIKIYFNIDKIKKEEEEEEGDEEEDDKNTKYAIEKNTINCLDQNNSINYTKKKKKVGSEKEEDVEDEEKEGTDIESKGELKEI